MSEGLEAFERIKSYFNPKQLLTKEKTLNDLDVIEKELKALEIIRNKGVFVHLLQQSKSVEEYNSLMIIAFKKKAERDYKGAVEKFCLTEEEYNLLKEVLL